MPSQIAPPEAVNPLKQKHNITLSETTQHLIDLEAKYTVGGFTPLPAFIEKAKGSKLWDVDGKEYIDFICMFSAVNQGHCHPKIVQALVEQANKAYLLNTATHNARWPVFAELMCKRFNYDQISPMVSGAEGADLACKIARKWGHVVKGIPAEKVHVLGVSDCYHGLASGVWTLQNESAERTAYGLENKLQSNKNPSTGELLRYGYLEDMEHCFREHHQEIAAVILEPIRNTGCTFETEVNYARGLYDLCKRYGILYIADEIRMGCGKTGKFFSYNYLGDDCRPDLVVVGKSITGGAYPASYVLGPAEIMGLVKPYEAAGTFVHTPLGVAVSEAALKVIDDERLVEKAAEIGDKFRALTESWLSHPLISGIEIRGADIGLHIRESGRVTARRLGALCLSKGVLMYPLYGRLRISIAMVITDAELEKGVAIIKEALDEMAEFDDIPGEVWHQPL